MPNTKPTEATLFVRAVLRGVRRGLKLIRRRGRGYTRYYAPEGVLGEYDYTHIQAQGALCVPELPNVSSRGRVFSEGGSL